MKQLKMKNNRKIFLINKKFQLSILGWFSLLTLILITVFYSAVWYFFYNFKQQAVQAGLPTNHIFFVFLKNQQLLMDKVFIASSLVAIIVLFIGGLFLSHKVAGPLYRLTQHLKHHSKSDVTPLKFRKGDYFIEIEESFNEFINK